MSTIAIRLTGDDDEELAPEFAAPTPSTTPFAQPPAPPTLVPSPAPALPVPAGLAVATPVASSAAGAPAMAALPQFEKANVTKTEIKISGSPAIDTFGEVVVGLDDRVRAVGEFRVAKILHYVSKEGDVVRQQVLVPIGELSLAPWDSTDPNDDGIVRVRP